MLLKKSRIRNDTFSNRPLYIIRSEQGRDAYFKEIETSKKILETLDKEILRDLGNKFKKYTRYCNKYKNLFNLKINKPIWTDKERFVIEYSLSTTITVKMIIKELYNQEERK